MNNSNYTTQNDLLLKNLMIFYKTYDLDGMYNLNNNLDKILKIITGEVYASKLLLSKESKIKGNPLKIAQFFSSFKKPAPNFPLITRPEV